MDGDFLVSYIPKDEYKEIGYHKTLCIKMASIRENGFEPSNNDNDWLGMGVYFWDNIENAKWWRNSTEALIKTCIITCELKCDLSQYLDLDVDWKMTELDNFSHNYIKNLRAKHLRRPRFENANQKKKFFCDLYCTQNNIIILSHTFRHDIMNKAGFKIGTKERRQICVRDPKYIQILSVDGGD